MISTFIKREERENDGGMRMAIEEEVQRKKKENNPDRVGQRECLDEIVLKQLGCYVWIMIFLNSLILHCIRLSLVFL